MTIEGLMVIPSDADFARTVRRLEIAMAARCIAPIARIDHAHAARGIGLELDPTLLLIFGNPSLGTPLMQSRPTIGIDLPLKILVWEAGGFAKVAYNEPTWIADRHGGDALAPELETMGVLLKALAKCAAGPNS